MPDLDTTPKNENVCLKVREHSVDLCLNDFHVSFYGYILIRNVLYFVVHRESLHVCIIYAVISLHCLIFVQNNLIT